MRFVQPMVLAALLANPLEAQDTVTPDSTVSDSLPAAPRHDWLLLPALAGLGTVFAVAPPALFLIPGLLKPVSTRALADHYLAAYFMGGGIGSKAPSSWTHSENIELVQGSLYASLSMEHIYGQERLRYQTIRAGYLFRPNRGVAGGVTVGYRSGSGTGGQNAVLIGFPITAGSQEGSARLEPVYAISSVGVSWTLRFQTEVYLLPKPMFAGFIYEAKPLRQGAPYQGTLALLVGVRH